MRQSACALFPFKKDNANSCLGRAETLEDTLLSSIRLFLVTRPGSRVGNVVGSFLPTLMFQLLSSDSLQGYAAELKSELSANFVGVDFLRVELTRDLSKKLAILNVLISFMIPSQANVIDLLVEMPSVFDSSSFKDNNSLVNTTTTLSYPGNVDFSL